MKNSGAMRTYMAELIGTFALVFCGTAAIVVNQETGGVISHTGIAMTFGLIVMAMIYTFGDTSGAHINPAVTIAFLIMGHFSFKKLLPYIVSQLSGAILASALIYSLFPENEFLGATLPAGSSGQTFILEVLLTFLLMLVILKVSTGRKEKGIIAGLTIGSVVLLEALFAGPVTGASMNPARSIAPAIISGHLEYLWIYISAPIIGAAMAVPVCKYVL